MENKIILEITAQGWTKTAIINGIEMKEVSKLTSFGATTVDGSFEADENVSDELYDALDSLGGYDAARYIQKLGDR